MKYYLYLCKFQDTTPNYDHYVNFIKKNRETEYHTAKSMISLLLMF